MGNVITAVRAVYGKVSTPIELREYHSRLVGGSGVGTRKDWLEIAKGFKFDAVIFVELNPWNERTTANLGVDNIVRSVIGMANRMPEANTMAFNIPPLPGIGSLGGFSFILQDRSGHTAQELDETTKAFLAEARKRPEIALIYSTFRTDTPGYNFDVDREKAQKMGVPVAGVFNTLQAFLGRLQVNDFNRFGRRQRRAQRGHHGTARHGQEHHRRGRQ